MNVVQPSSATAAPRLSPVWLVRLRRLLAVPVAVALVLGAPGLAYATFTAKTGSSMAVGTYSIPAPATATGSGTCNKGPRGATANITSFAAVSKATSYIATVTAPDGSTSSQTVAPGGFVLSRTSSKAGTFTLEIKARVGSWTGAAFQLTLVCP
ncbi:hypothetical protein [Arthrobacter sp. SO5]|uniref:hypothetical protein n=1 Tax=Arthrobacter sp. SO5 TaxID=1897055 RepID=UPI001E47CFED|nr:hypothetical protein [Arthrobacter sp. SO5]